MEVILEFNESAFRHGVDKEDIRHAFQNYKYDGPIEAYTNKYIRIGFNRAGNLLEVMYNETEDCAVIVFHAMKCRSIYFHLLDQ